MVSRSFAYPIPVVGWGDDVEGRVDQFSLEHSVHGEDLVLAIKGLQVTNPTVAALVSAGVFGWAIRLHCKATYFRRTWVFDGPDATLRIPLCELSQSVELAVQVVARRAMENYQPAGLHPDFGQARFRINPGDVVAIGPDAEIYVDLGFDPLKGEVSSIMVVKPGLHDTGPVEADFAGPRIAISIPKLDWETYKSIKNESPASIHAAIVLPVLVEAISLVRDEARGSGYAELLWYGRVRAWLDARNLDPADPFGAAQKLLDLPLARMFAAAAKALAQEDSSS